MTMEDKKLSEEFNEFLLSPEVDPPRLAREAVLSHIHHQLNPPGERVFLKMLGIHTVVSLFSLSICSQFGVQSLRLYDAMGSMMDIVGSTYCMAFCGVLYLGISAIAFSFFLKPEEIKVIRRYKFLQLALLSGVSLGVFLCLGATVLFIPGALWIVGSFVGGATGLELGWLIRAHFRKQLLVLGLLLILSLSAHAHPVSYEGATAVMTWNQSFMSDSWITYSFRRDAAVAARFMRMEMPEGRLTYTGAQLDYLVFRKNELNSQANLYAYGGAGNVNYQSSQGGAGFVGLEADGESRTYFSLIKSEYMRSTVSPEFSHVEARLGVAPYEADYSEIASWFMVQAQWHPALAKKLVVTPLARFFYKSVLWETGVSTDGDWMMNFMFHF